MKSFHELVVTAPTQVKSELNLGNEYEFTLADFYNKVSKLCGNTTVFPAIFNANGKPIEELSEKLGKDAHEVVTECIETACKQLEENYVQCTEVVRDDELEEQLTDWMNATLLNRIEKKDIDVVVCPNCNSEFGTDAEIKVCKHCGCDTEIVTKNTLCMPVSNKEIADHASAIHFVPEGAQKRLNEFVQSLTEEYDLSLEKNREYTLSYEGTRLDPRFVTIATIGILNQKYGPFDKITFIQGDVVKKFDYYALCYLNPEEHPTNVYMHGLITDKEGKKLRWRNCDNANLGVKKRELRAFFLKHNIDSNIAINVEELKKLTKEQVNLFITTKRLLDERNLDVKLQGVRLALDEMYKKFLSYAYEMKLQMAYQMMKDIMDYAWKLTKDEKLSEAEQDVIRTLQELYFGA